MKSIIHQPFCNIVHLYARGGFERAQIENKFVSNPTARASVKNRVVVGKSFGEVVGVQDGDFGATGEAFTSHHGEEHPRDDQDAGAAVRSGGDGSDLIFC